MNNPKTLFPKPKLLQKNYQTSLSADYYIQDYDYSITDEFGNRKRLINNLLHRTDGPAIDCRNGKTEWWLNGLRHRNNAPAMEWPNGKKEWWLDGKYYDEDLYRMIQFFNGINVQLSQH